MAMSKFYYVHTRIPTVQILVQKEERRSNYIGSNNIQYLEHNDKKISSIGISFQ